MPSGRKRPLPTHQSSSLQQEFECDFIGSAGTLIAGSHKLKSLVYDDPMYSSAGLDIYEEPIQGT